MIIRAQLQSMAASEIAGMVPADKLASIKQGDPSPLIKAFVVGHEGEAKGRLIGLGNIIKRWFKDTVEKLHDRITAGLQLFHGHGPTNDRSGSTPVGEIVGKSLKQIDGRQSVVVACYIYPPFRHLPLDVASIEAELDLKPEGDDGFRVLDITNITGVALGNSQVDTPGFPGATLLGQLQAFAEQNGVKLAHECDSGWRLGHRIKDNTIRHE